MICKVLSFVLRSISIYQLCPIIALLAILMNWKWPQFTEVQQLYYSMYHDETTIARGAHPLKMSYFYHNCVIHVFFSSLPDLGAGRGQVQHDGAGGGNRQLGPRGLRLHRRFHLRTLGCHHRTGLEKYDIYGNSKNIPK